MKTERPNKIPKPNTIARHYHEGRYCDYPADILLSAVNTHEYDYNPTAIPVNIGFKQMFTANFEAFAYLCEHRDESTIHEFLRDPDGFMDSVGIKLPIHFDKDAPKIIAAILEDDMFEAFKDPEGQAVCNLVHRHTKAEGGWCMRHPERYLKNTLTTGLFTDLPEFPENVIEND